MKIEQQIHESKLAIIEYADNLAEAVRIREEAARYSDAIAKDLEDERWNMACLEIISDEGKI